MNTDHAIRELAHQLWVFEGKPEGEAKKHWAQASIEVAQKNDNIDRNPKKSTVPSDANGSIEPEQPDQT